MQKHILDLKFITFLRMEELLREFNIPCPDAVDDNPIGAELLIQMFTNFTSVFLEITNIIPFLKGSNENRKRCSWQVIARDTETRQPNSLIKNTFLDFLETNKPRNSEAVVLRYNGGNIIPILLNYMC